MNELRTILIKHGVRYPKWRPQDAVKLIYQNEFGGGHIIEDAAASLSYLEQEIAAINSDSTSPLCEDIGGGLCRLNLSACKAAGYALTLINRLFVASASGVQGNISAFVQKLDVLRTVTAEHGMPFSAQDLQQYLDGYIKENYPMVRHSELFREQYQPSYRVVLAKYLKHIDLLADLDRLVEQDRPAVVAIDGRCGSGKSSLAEAIADIFDCNIIHMDDFFLPPELRTEERLGEPGGNIHYERFLDEVLPGLRSGIAFRHRVFDCSVMDYADEWTTVPPKPLTIVEGTYSLHPHFADVYDRKLFTTCSPEVQQLRILERNGPEMLQRFVEEWIPMEERYFSSFSIPASCDWVLSTDEDGKATPSIQ